MRGLRQCRALYTPHTSHTPRSLGLHRILYRTLYANYRPGPALSSPALLSRALLSPAPSGTTEVPSILHQNGNTAVTVATTHQRWKHRSAGTISRWKTPHHYKWVSEPVPENLYHLLEPHLLNSTHLAAQRFPVVPATPEPDVGKHLPLTQNPHSPDNQAPPLPHDPDLDFDSNSNSPRSGKTYSALVIDCEMVAMKGGEQGLINIAVVDFFTGYVVLRTLVRPTGPVTDWRREVTRFNKPMMNEAIKKGRTLSGWREVRDRIFDVTTSETIFIGHAPANDLRVLRIATDRVIDSMTMMASAVFGDVKKFPRSWGLKTACKELLGVDVQKRNGPHKPLEDALASREIVLQSVLQPEKLAAWAAKIRANLAQIEEKEREAERKKQERREVNKERKKLQKAEKALRKAERAKMDPEELEREAAEETRRQEEHLRQKREKKHQEVQEKKRKKLERLAKRKQPTASVKMRTLNTNRDGSLYE
ncbi:ribonuclease H-like domain-containing protein [Xylaria sp. FL1042]|nr:ribonuclease H-like domain-containing protein [Xylaria sp. FL1042]